MSRQAFAEVFKGRTKELALRVMKLVDSLPSTLAAQAIGRQVVRSATSVAANYRAACRARSGAEFKAKLHIALEEADETVLWLELLEEGQVVKAERISPLRQEATEVMAILAAAERTAREKAHTPS